jgi:hydroxymethylbilane synthase
VSDVLRVGTRRSALALWQTESVRARLHAAGLVTERIEIRTTGDAVTDVPLSRIGSRALFTKQLDDALLEGGIDLAVHSLKDLPTALPDGIAIAAVSAREDPSDALVVRRGGPRSITALPHGATVATSSLRRRAQLLAWRADLHVAEVRGNVDTRLAKLDASAEWSAIVLAAAGLLRLGLAERIGERIAPEIMLPAPGQGALVVTARAGDARVRRALATLHDEAAWLAVTAERAFLGRLEGGCQVPVAALATPGADGELRLRGRVLSLDGRSAVSVERLGRASSAADAEALGDALAAEALARGAGPILAAVRASAAPAVTGP